MDLKKLLTILVVSTVVLAAMSTVIEAQRGGGSGGDSGGGMGGGHHWSVNAGSEHNVGDDNNEGNNAGAIEVYVSTDRRRYVLGEPIEITVTAYNPTDSTITLVGSSGPFWCGPASYAIDGTAPEDLYRCVAGDIYYTPIPPKGSDSWSFTHTESIFPVIVGTHRVVGSIFVNGAGRKYSESITIWIVEPNNGGMGGHSR